jgi:branched-chain amino acid transport system substrate-binding protein
MAWKRYGTAVLMALLVAVFMVGCGNNEEASGTETDSGGGDEAQETVKIGVLASLTGALESYGDQTKKGFELGMDYATDGTGEVAGKKIEIIYEDTETDPKVARQKALKLLEEDKVDFLVGSSSSGDTLAVTPPAVSSSAGPTLHTVARRA